MNVIHSGSSVDLKSAPNIFSCLPDRESRKASTSKSVILCDEFFRAFGRKLPNLHIKHEHNWCSIWDAGPIIAWVSHSPLRGSIKIWFIGDLEKARQLSTVMDVDLKLTPIMGTLGDCTGNFKISKVAQVPGVVDLLSRLIAGSSASREIPLF